jgi:hypothetical protein
MDKNFISDDKREFADQLQLMLSTLKANASDAQKGKFSQDDIEQINYAVSVYGTSFFSGMVKHLSMFQLDLIERCAAKEIAERDKATQKATLEKCYTELMEERESK